MQKWIYQDSEGGEGDHKSPSAPRDTWFLTDGLTSDNKPKIIGVFYRDRDEKWMLVDMRGQGQLSIPFGKDKTIVECKDRLVKWLRDKE